MRESIEAKKATRNKIMRPRLFSHLPLSLTAFAILLTGCFSSLSETPSGSPAADQNGQFWRIHWYEKGITNGNPLFEGRLRVNAPELALDPDYGHREEGRANGMALILAEEDLSKLTAAKLYLEAWGGHPGTANKRFIVNGRDTYFLPHVGTEEMNCTYFYPETSLKISDLVNGYNAFQFAVDQGKAFWGHMLVDNARLRVGLTNNHPDILKDGLGGFNTSIKVAPPLNSSESLNLSLVIPLEFSSLVESVDFQGNYFGYDENGNGLMKDWHGFTKNRIPVAFLGTATNQPFGIIWNTSMLPAQKEISVRATVHFKGHPDIEYETELSGLEIPERNTAQVTLYSSHDLPTPFWSRANEKRRCSIYLDVGPSEIEQADLYVNTWTGGAGQVKDYFTLNGHQYPVAEGTTYELMYSHIAIDPATLKRGRNEIEVLSDTDGHGIEVLLPGPCLMVRTKR